MSKRKTPQGNSIHSRAQRHIETATRIVRSRRSADRAEDKLLRQITRDVDHGNDQAIERMFRLGEALADDDEADEVRGELELALEQASEQMDDVCWSEAGTLYDGAQAELIAVGVVGAFAGEEEAEVDDEALYRAFDESGIAGADEAIFFAPYWAHPRTLLALTYSNRKRLLGSLLHAAQRKRRGLRLPPQARALLAMDEPAPAPGADAAIELGLRVLVGVAMRYGVDTSEFVELEQLERFSQLLHPALEWNEHFPLTVASYDTFTQGIRTGVEHFSDLAFFAQIDHLAQSAPGPCQVSLDLAQQPGMIVAHMMDGHGVLGDIHRGLAPWEDAHVVADWLAEALEQRGVLDYDEE